METETLTVDKAVELALTKFANRLRRPVKIMQSRTGAWARNLDLDSLLAQLCARPHDSSPLRLPAWRKPFDELLSKLSEQYGYDETVEAIQRHGETLER